MERKKRYSSCRSVLLVLLGLLYCAQVAAVEKSLYIRRHFTIDNGLPQSSVDALMQDRNGFLWVATQGGLCRFDGRRFVVYNSTNSPLPLDRIQALGLDPDGSLMVLSAQPDQRIYRIDENYELLRDRRFGRLGFFFITGHPVVRIEGTVSLHSSGGALRQVSGVKLWSEASRVFPVDSERFYYTDGDTLLLIDIRQRTFRTCGNLPGWKKSMTAGDYLLTFDNRMRCRFWKEGVPVQAPVTPALASLLQRFQLKLGTEQVAYIRNNGNASCLLRTGSEIWLVKQKGALLDAELLTGDIDPGQIIGGMLYDEQNRILFVGTATDGLYVYQRNDFETIVHDGGTPQVNNIYTQFAIGDQWVLNAYFRFDPFRKITEALPADFRPMRLSGFYRSPGGNIWYASDRLMHIADSNLHLLRSFPVAPDSSMLGAAFFAEDEDHTAWVAAGRAVGRIQAEQVSFLPLAPAYLEQNNITYLFPFDRDWLWLGTENGILPCNKKTGKAGPLLLPGKPVKYIFRAKNGGIWICTYGKGIYKYESGRFIALPVDAQKHLLFAHCIIEDAHGFFWIPTNKGLFQCRRTELEDYIGSGRKGSIYYYHHQNIGKYTDEFNSSGGNATVAYCKNLVLLPGMRGVLSFDPLAVVPVLPGKVILTEHISCDGRPLGSHSSFTLPPGFLQLQLDVAAPYFGSEENNVLEYRLSGTSPYWYPVINGRIVYNRLPQGTYQLDIRKRTGFGTGNYTYRRLTFEVEPYWYQTWWFRITAIFLVALTVFYFVRRRINHLKRAKRVLEQKVNERTAELQETIAVLDKSEQELSRINKIQDQAMAIILHDIRSPLHYLSLATRLFNGSIGKLSGEELKQHAASIMISTDRIDKFTNDLVAWLYFNRDTSALTTDRFELPDLLKEVESLYAEMARQKNNQLLVETVEPGSIVTDRNKLYLVLRNLVDNANKYCSDGRIVLGARWIVPGRKLSITVADTGSGIPQEDIDKLQHASSAGPDLQYGKLGLAMVHYFMHLMQGHIAISSEAGKGTTVTIILEQ